jgi:lysophospholipase L1-like esterase
MSTDRRLVEFHERMEKKAPLTVVAFGDSWTYGSVADGWHEARDAGLGCESIHGSWAMQLKKILHERNPQVAFYNKGVGGWKSGQGLAAFEEKVMTHRPNLLLLNFGINDWKGNVVLSDYEMAMEGMIQKTLQAGCHCVLWISGPLSIQSDEHYGWHSPVNDSGFPHSYEEFTDVLHKLAAKYDLLIADAAKEIMTLWQSETDLSGWFHDAIHFKQDGHNLILKSMIKTLSLH